MNQLRLSSSKPRVINAIGVALTLLISQMAFADSCDTLILQGLRNIAVKYSHGAALAVSYHRYCETDYDSQDSSIHAAIDVDVFGFGSGNGSLSTAEKKQKLKQWCDDNRALAQSDNTSYQMTNNVYQGALDAWTRCYELKNQSALQQDYYIPDSQRSVQISLATQQGTLGVPYIGTVATGFTCTAEQWDEAHGVTKIDPTKSTVIKGFAIKISCTRKQDTTADGRTHLADGLVTVRTTQLKDINLAFPEEYQPSVDATTKQTLEAKIASLCVGCIQASTLTEADFKALNGNNWVLCDGRDISGSKLAQAIHQTKAPDLRGVFLRGKNYGRFSEVKELEAGKFEPDQLGRHGHGITDPGHQHPIMVTKGNEQTEAGILWNVEGIAVKPDKLVRSATTGISVNDYPGVETAPKNVIVNYFLKIN